MGMSHLKIISTSQGHIHKYENLKEKYIIATPTYILTTNVSVKI